MFKEKMKVKLDKLFQLVLERSASFRMGELNLKLEKSWQLEFSSTVFLHEWLLGMLCLEHHQEQLV